MTSIEQHSRKLAIQSYRGLTLPLRTLVRRNQVRSGTVPLHILFYHRIANDFQNSWTMCTADFDQQISWLQKHFKIVSLQEIQRRIDSGFNREPCVAVTFDDGYAENCENALPLLIKRAIPFTYFVCLQNMLTGQFFSHDVKAGKGLCPNSIESLRQLAAVSQCQIGAHTRNHANIGGIENPLELHDELIQASEELAALVRQPIHYFAFPYGTPANMSPLAFQLLKEHGFRGVCSAYGGTNQVGGDSFHLQRMHGDPLLCRVQNWLTNDPRVARVKRYDYQDFDRDEYQRFKSAIALSARGSGRLNDAEFDIPTVHQTGLPIDTTSNPTVDHENV
jgi:peptidoglycan/xylan/chitin deacetylase (PgdA/CDA1 family)